MSNEDKKKTLINSRSEIREARVIANYGDPGLDEDYHFDILSRFVVVMFESCDRIVSSEQWPAMIAVVKRPDHLWIDVEGALTTPTSQRRSDSLGNINMGLASNYSSSSIARINTPYYLGETIKVRRLPYPLTPENDSIFMSRDSVFSPNVTYGNWHTEGSSLSYFVGDADKILALRQKTIDPHPSYSNFYRFYLNKYQYEAFTLYINSTDSSKTSMLQKIFSNNYGGVTPVYTANGGYYFSNYSYMSLNSIEYEDINIGNKQRTISNDCVPLVVTTPNSFPTPRTRNVGTIAYNPTYATIIR